MPAAPDQAQVEELAQLLEQHPDEAEALLTELAQEHPEIAELLAQFGEEGGEEKPQQMQFAGYDGNGVPLYYAEPKPADSKPTWLGRAANWLADTRYGRTVQKVHAADQKITGKIKKAALGYGNFDESAVKRDKGGQFMAAFGPEHHEPLVAHVLKNTPAEDHADTEHEVRGMMTLPVGGYVSTVEATAKDAENPPDPRMAAWLPKHVRTHQLMEDYRTNQMNGVPFEHLQQLFSGGRNPFPHQAYAAYANADDGHPTNDPKALIRADLEEAIAKQPKGGYETWLSCLEHCLSDKGGESGPVDPALPEPGEQNAVGASFINKSIATAAKGGAKHIPVVPVAKNLVYPVASTAAKKSGMGALKLAGGIGAAGLGAGALAGGSAMAPKETPPD